MKVCNPRHPLAPQCFPTWACFWLQTPESIGCLCVGSLDLPEGSAKGFSHPLVTALRMKPCNLSGLGTLKFLIILIVLLSASLQ